MTPLLSLPDLLVFLPYHLGFALRDALVVLALDGRRLALVERVDLPEAGPLPTEAVDRMVGGLHRLRSDPDVVLVVAFVGDRPPFPAQDQLMEAVGRDNPCVRRVLVANDAWYDGAAGEWRPLPLPADVALVAEYVGRGIAPLPSRSSLEDLLDPAPSPEVDAAVAELRPGRVDLDCGWRAWERLVHEAADPGPPGPQRWATGDGRSADSRDDGGRRGPEDSVRDVATVLALLADVPLRDAFLGRLVPLGRGAGENPTVHHVRAPLDTLDAESPGDVPREPTDALDALASRVATRAVLLRLARQAPGSLRATALAVLAAWAWHAGDGALADVASSAALDREPEHSLAEIVACLVGLDVPPPGV